jgi:hypothetical protein
MAWSSGVVLTEGPIGFDVGTESLSACRRLLLRLIKRDVLFANDNAIALAA